MIDTEENIEERIYCSAIWYYEIQPNSPLGIINPVNITKGVVVLGHRHGDIIRNVSNLLGLRTVQNGENSCGKYTQGFITNKNRFVNRKEAADIAVKSKQIIDYNKFNKKCLYSEDIY